MSWMKMRVTVLQTVIRMNMITSQKPIQVCGTMENGMTAYQLAH